MQTHKTAAWPLAQVYIGLIVYASLYPFGPWRNQGVPVWSFLLTSWPRYWTGFDVVSNLLGYVPLGFLLALAAVRSGRARWVLALALLPATVLSLALETCQVYLLSRVASNLDFALNVVGAAVGCLVAWSLERLGWLQRWNRFRDSWFVQDAHGALVLLALWPIALLFPTPIPFGLGQVLERLEWGLAQLLQNSAFMDWLPVRDVEFQPLLPLTEATCVMLGLLIPGLLGFSVIRHRAKRLWYTLWLLLTGTGAVALSAALSFGPEHAWAWLTGPIQKAIIVAALGLCMAVVLPARAVAALTLLAVGINLSLINQSGSGPYFDQTLFMWEQGQFIRFHGVAQWLGWLWPFTCLAYLLARLGSKDRPN